MASISKGYLVVSALMRWIIAIIAGTHDILGLKLLYAGIGQSPV